MLIKRLLLILLFLLTSQLCLADREITAEIRDTTAVIVSKSYTELDKTRAIYTWIAENISYDEPAFKNKNYYRYMDDLSFDEVAFVYRKSVCEGYANLFTKMCGFSGLEAKSIEGWAFDYTAPSQNLLAQDTNHVWNVVKINGRWRLVDVSWGALNKDSDYLRKQETDYSYFDADPQVLIRTHFPKDTSWQLQKDKISQEQFLQMIQNYRIEN